MNSKFSNHPSSSSNWNPPGSSSMDSEACSSSTLDSEMSSSSAMTPKAKEASIGYPLTDLPPHIFTKILQKLPNKSRIHMRQTNSIVNGFMEYNRNVIAAPPLREPLYLDLTIYEIPRPPERDCVRYKVRQKLHGERINVSSPDQLSALSIHTITVSTTTYEDLTVQMGYARQFLTHIRQKVREIVFYDIDLHIILEMMTYLHCESIIINGTGGCRTILSEPSVQRCMYVTVPLMDEEFPEEVGPILNTFKPFQEVFLSWCSVEFAFAVIWEMATTEDLGNLRRVTVPTTNARFFTNEVWRVPANTSMWASSGYLHDVYRQIFCVVTETRFILYLERKISHIAGAIYTLTIIPMEKNINALLKYLTKMILPDTVIDLTNYMEAIETADSLDSVADNVYNAYLDWIPTFEKGRSR